MSVIVTAGQRGDSPQFRAVLGEVAGKRPGGVGCPRTRPVRVRADKACASAGFYLGVVSRYRDQIDRGLGESILPVLLGSLGDHLGPAWEEASDAGSLRYVLAARESVTSLPLDGDVQVLAVTAADVFAVPG
jgi:hypothetical protein